MKRLVTILFAFIMVFSMASCSSRNDESRGSDSKQSKQDINKAIELIKEHKDIFEGNIFEDSDRLYLEMQDGDAKIVYYIHDNNNRYDYTDSQGTTITIRNADEGKIYIYKENEKKGEVTETSGSYNKEVDKAFAKFDFSFVLDSIEENVEKLDAKIIDYNGEKVLYFLVGSSEDDSMGDMEVWYSIENKFPVKIIMKNKEGEVMKDFIVNKLETDGDYSKYMEVPEGMEWEELK